MIWHHAYTTTETPIQTKNFVQPSISIYPTFHIIAADLICHCIGFDFVARLLVKLTVFIKDIKHCLCSPFVLLFCLSMVWVYHIISGLQDVILHKRFIVLLYMMTNDMVYTYIIYNRRSAAMLCLYAGLLIRRYACCFCSAYNYAIWYIIIDWLIIWRLVIVW